MMRAKHDTQASRIKYVRQLAGLSQEQFASKLGTTRGAVGNWELGKGIKQNNLSQISEVFGVSVDWLMSKKGIAPGPDGAPEDEFDAVSRPVSGIQEIDVRAGLGGGGTMDGREVRHDGRYADPIKPEAWHFPTQFMREEIRAPESQVVILETHGDSMEPTISSGERIIVHTGMRTPSPDGIFALRDTFGNIVAKRVQVLRRGDPPRVLIISDNKSHPQEEVGLDEITIVGRVLWGLKRL